MRIILDTHILLWALIDDAALGARARDHLLDPENEKYVSVVSLWEISIKHARNRGSANDMPIDAQTALARVKEAAFHILQVTPEHAVAVGGLAPHHGDPFDRMLIAQAIAEPMRLVTRDKMLAVYGDPVLLV